MKIRLNLSMLQEAIDQTRLYKGKKGHYLDATVMVDIGAPGQYGDHGMITQNTTKEERDAGTQGAILGNATIVWCDDDSVSFSADSAPTPPMAAPAPAPAPAPMAAAPTAPVITRQEVLIKFQACQGQDAANAYWSTLNKLQQDELASDL